MRSSKPFSTVSYNTPVFLNDRLHELLAKRVIDFFAFVEHYPEEDEKKSHIHLYLIPNGRQDTDQIRDYFDELDPENPQKPLRCLPFRSSKYDEWKQYNDHDEAYLASKGQTRKYHYNNSDYTVSDEVYFQELNHTIDRSKLNRNKVIVDAVDSGRSFTELVAKGQIPVQQIASYKMMYDILMAQKVYQTGTMRIDVKTGEKVPSHTPLDRPFED